MYKPFLVDARASTMLVLFIGPSQVPTGLVRCYLMFPTKVAEPGPSPSPNRAGFMRKFCQEFAPGRKDLSRWSAEDNQVSWPTAAVPCPAAQPSITMDQTSSWALPRIWFTDVDAMLLSIEVLTGLNPMLMPCYCQLRC
jgi:hypothetical protein